MQDISKHLPLVFRLCGVCAQMHTHLKIGSKSLEPGRGRLSIRTSTPSDPIRYRVSETQGLLAAVTHMDLSGKIWTWARNLKGFGVRREMDGKRAVLGTCQQ